MKIGFIGTGGTGKSSTALALAKATGLPIIQSPSRECFKRHGIETEDAQLKMSSQARLDLQSDIFRAITDQVMNIHTGIFERTPLDNFFYLLFRCHDIAENADVQRMDTYVKNGLRRFDLICFFPLLDWAWIDDGMRTNKLAARLQMDYFLSGYIDRLTAPRVKYMADGTIEQRVQIIQKAIKGVEEANGKST